MPTGEGSRFQASRVVAATGPARPAVIASPARRGMGKWGEPTPPGFGPFALLGLVFFLLSITGLILLNVVPWINPATGDSLSRSEIREDGLAGVGVPWDESLAYTKSLTGAPISSLIGLGVGGFVLVLLDAIPAVRLARAAGRLVLTGVLAFFALRLTVTAARWFGLYATQAMNGGDVGFHLHVGLYLLLLLALPSLGASVWFLRASARVFSDAAHPARYPQALPLSAWTLFAAGAGLVLTPLLPLTSSLEDDQHLGEVELAQFKNLPGFFGGEGLRDSADNLELVRLMLSLVLAVAALTLLAALFERSGVLPLLAGTLLQVYAINGILVIVGLVFVILLYANNLQDISAGLGGGGFTPVWNWFLPAAFLALVVLVLRYALAVSVPFFRAAVRQSAATPAAPETHP